MDAKSLEYHNALALSLVINQQKRHFLLRMHTTLCFF